MELIEREYRDLPHNGVRLPYAARSIHRYNDNRIQVVEALFTAFTSGECGLTRVWHVQISNVTTLASARKIARELGFTGPVETIVAGHSYGIRW
ncbi:hypothetical protein [Nocardia abscessus]|uniref:hypothetical protein n=1 Tax=Nocardia abscessus TaxID=120957 RepID=UPI0024566117|nr:hypothetical protein [Nocardia abscessus]